MRTLGPNEQLSMALVGPPIDDYFAWDDSEEDWWPADDSSVACRRSSRCASRVTSSNLDAHLRLHYLLSPDWPVVCIRCHCIVMKSYLALHISSVNYCEHAHTSTRVAGGTITRDRFAWYPGHPLYHLFHVGAWKTFATIVLHTHSMYHITSLKDDFL